MRRHQNRKRSSAGITSLGLLLLLVLSAGSARSQISITTYHYDNYRTGWNSSESALTPANVNSTSFGVLATVALDDQVDAQPLVVPQVAITAGQYKGTTHDVVYVATENNSVYAIDVHSGTILLSPNFGAPVGYPLGCVNNGPNVGITSTPVIDPTNRTLYVMVYNQDKTTANYRLHALDLGSLTDKVTPKLVSASHKLSDGTTFSFNPNYQRQRPALLFTDGSIYAAFGSFCDFGANITRGWVLGWSVTNLAPLTSNELVDTQASDADTFFLSSIWMSGYGPATDDAGNILFVTANSDPGSYDGVTNIQESVVKISPALNDLIDLFTPSNEKSLDETDGDFGSGGVLVLPDQPGSIPHMAVAAGKAGTMFLMNEDHLGGYSPSKNNVLGKYSIGKCWCGQSYFVDPSDGAGRVVASGGQSITEWKVLTSPTAKLEKVMSAYGIGGGGQDLGFFTSISSHGNSNPIIWALSRPTNTSNNINLFAFNPESGGTTMKRLFKATAGSWPNVTGNANLIPVVANGEVFVATNQQLQIFGLKSAKAASKK